MIDNAVILLTRVDEFWNLGNLEVRKRLQDLMFPEGLYYSFTEGFGTAKMSESHLLIEKVTINGDLNPNLVNLIESKWNLICEEIIRWNRLLGKQQWSIEYPAASRTMAYSV